MGFTPCYWVYGGKRILLKDVNIHLYEMRFVFCLVQGLNKYSMDCRWLFYFFKACLAYSWGRGSKKYKEINGVQWVKNVKTGLTC